MKNVKFFLVVLFVVVVLMFVEYEYWSEIDYFLLVIVVLRQNVCLIFELNIMLKIERVYFEGELRFEEKCVILLVFNVDFYEWSKIKWFCKLLILDFFYL